MGRYFMLRVWENIQQACKVCNERLRSSNADKGTLCIIYLEINLFEALAARTERERAVFLFLAEVLLTSAILFTL